MRDLTLGLSGLCRFGVGNGRPDPGFPTPYSFCKTGKSPTRRELIIPFGATGYIAIFEIASASVVLVLAVRHQREEDYH